MNYEELRPLVLEALKRLKGRPYIQLVDAINETDQVAVSKGLMQGITPWSFRDQATTHYMPVEDRETARQILMDYILSGLLTIGSDEQNYSFPFIRITDYGEECLASSEILPYDPIGYLKRLRSEIKSIDKTTEMYLEESLQTFLRGNFLSSMVMLGVASEKTFLLLLDALTNAITDPDEKASFEQLKSDIRIKRKFDKVKAKIYSIRARLPNDLNNNLESNVEGIFHLIRISRNDAGHPTGRKIKREDAYTNLQLFIPYCKAMYQLIRFLRRNRV